MELLKEIITSIIPDAQIDESAQWLNVSVNSDNWLSLAKELHSRKELMYDYLFCVTGVDWKTHLSMVYHLSSSENKNIIVVKAKIENRNDASIDSVSHLWRTAEFHEREAYDLFGIKFNGHPDLRRLFLTDEWKGWPLRKDYEDEVNMVRL